MSEQQSFNVIWPLDQPEQHQITSDEIMSISNNPDQIAEWFDPPEELQLLAVIRKPELIVKIPNPTKAVQIAVVASDPSLIEYIAQPFKIVQYIAKNGRK